MKSYALQQLSHFRTVQLGIQFRLAEKDNLQQLALLGFQVGQQAQSLQCFDRHRLRLVDADYYPFFCLGML